MDVKKNECSSVKLEMKKSSQLQEKVPVVLT